MINNMIKFFKNIYDYIVLIFQHINRLEANLLVEMYAIDNFDDPLMV